MQNHYGESQIMKNNIQLYFLILTAFLFFLLSYLGLLSSYAPSLALITGVIISFTTSFDYAKKKLTGMSTKVLSYAIILLGFGLNFRVIIEAGVSGLGYTVVSIFGSIIIGLLLGRLLKNDGKTSVLVTVGTAICGGSAIAAIAPSIKANNDQVAISLGIVFILNGICLILFPILGHILDLSQHQFGVLSALAIHDTSSVVGATSAYGQESLVVGTTIKLVRALWIIPVAIMFAIFYSKDIHPHAPKAKKPWFILWFMCASILVTVFPSLQEMGTMLKHIGESLFVVALFLVGYGISFSAIKTVGFRVMLQGVILWLIVTTAVIWSIMSGLIA
jgi:uncharacterized integral membrane protein (TIGR00698 family)